MAVGLDGQTSRHECAYAARDDPTAAATSNRKPLSVGNRASRRQRSELRKPSEFVLRMVSHNVRSLRKAEPLEMIINTRGELTATLAQIHVTARSSMLTQAKATSALPATRTQTNWQWLALRSGGRLPALSQSVHPPLARHRPSPHLDSRPAMPPTTHGWYPTIAKYNL